MAEKHHSIGLQADELIDRYLRHRRHDWPSAETKRVRRLQIVRINEALGGSLHEATEDDLMDWRDRLPGTPETVGSYVSAATGFYTWLSSIQRVRPDNPTALLRRPKIPPAQPRPILERHYELALACALSDPEMYLWLGLMGCSGLRCCEIAWMRTTDFTEHPEAGAVAHLLGKGGKRRAVPIGSNLALTLRPFLLGRGHVFTRSDGAPHTPHSVSKKTNRFLHGLGIAETAHQLRHRFGTDYHGIDPDMLRQAEIMGHASVATTRRYTQIDPLEAAQFIERLTRRRFGNRPADGRRAA